MITFIDILKEKVTYYLRNNKLGNKDVQINEQDIKLYNGKFQLYDDYCEFQYAANFEKLYYNSISRISTNNGTCAIETVNHKSFLLDNEEDVLTFMEILQDTLQSRDNIFQILKMNDGLSDKKSLRLTEGSKDKIEVSEFKEAQIKLALLIEAKKFDEARNLLSKVSSYQPQNVTNYFSSYLQRTEAKFENKPFLYYDSLLPALNMVQEEQYNHLALKNLIERYVDYQNNFFAIPQDRRKFVVITDEFYGVPKKGFLMLLKNFDLNDTHPLYHSVDTSMINLPDGMSFPVGHPIINNVYVVHPYNDRFYIPVEDQEEYLFNDRIDELKSLVQAFGATEIKFSKEHRLKVDRNQASSLNVEVELNAKGHGANVDYNKTKEENNYSGNEQVSVSSQISSQILKPYIPENLIWYPRETKWQHWYKQRINGNDLRQIEEEIRSKSHKTVSTNEIMDINVGLKVFFVKANVGVRKEIKANISEEEEMVQKISVTFASVNDLTEEYKEETKKITEKRVARVNYKNQNTQLVPMVFLENRKPQQLPPVLGKNIRIPISEEHNVYLDMIYVEGGTYWMGTDDPAALKISPTSTLKQVTVNSFYISKYTITSQQYIRVIDDMFGILAALPKWLTKGMIEKKDFFESFVTQLNSKTGLRFALPNNHLWEYAARGGKYSKGYIYAGSNDVLDVAWMGESDNPSLKSVGMKKANELGIHDMSGNIYELVYDLEEPTSDHLTLRGGGYWSKEEFCTVYHKVDISRYTNINKWIGLEALNKDVFGNKVTSFEPKTPGESILKEIYEGKEKIGFRVILPASEIEKLEIVENKEQLVKIK